MKIKTSNGSPTTIGKAEYERPAFEILDIQLEGYVLTASETTYDGTNAGINGVENDPNNPWN